jgi:hypothetical protein
MFGKDREERARERELRMAELNTAFELAFDSVEKTISEGTRALLIASVVGGFIGGALGAGVVVLLTR